MSKTVYVSLSELSQHQTKAMRHIETWVHEEKTPAPLTEIIKNMSNEGISKNTTVKALYILIEKGYIRRAYTVTNKTFFVQLRGL